MNPLTMLLLFVAMIGVAALYDSIYPPRIYP